MNGHPSELAVDATTSPFEKLVHLTSSGTSTICSGHWGPNQNFGQVAIANLLEVIYPGPPVPIKKLPIVMESLPLGASFAFPGCCRWSETCYHRKVL